MYKLFIYGGMALAGLTLFGKNKISGIAAVAEQLDVSVNKIRQPKIIGNTISLLVDMDIYNPTDQSLTISSGKVLTLKSIRFYDVAGKFLGEAYPNLSGIEVAAKNGRTITNIPAVISLQNVDALFNTMIDTFLGQRQLNYQLTFEALGKSFTINA